MRFLPVPNLPVDTYVAASFIQSFFLPIQELDPSLHFGGPAIGGMGQDHK
jgi:hypothetical protein